MKKRTTLSVGQRQRHKVVGARYSHSKLIVLDEAIPALDAEIVQLVAGLILNMKEFATVSPRAHRLLNKRSADLVCYMESREIKCAETFSEVSSRVLHLN